MSVISLLDERVTFSLDVPVEVNNLLQAAVEATQNNTHRAEQLFVEAQSRDSRCLQTYFALYKFYFFQKRLVDAERIVLAGLAEAAQQGGFPNDYRRLASEAPQWNLYASDISRFYLYTLKALAFIKLRQGDALDAQLILAQMRQMDPEDLSGVSVIMDLAAGVTES